MIGSLGIEIDSDGSVFTGAKRRIIHQFPESDVLDWITSSDGGSQAQIKVPASLPLNSMECEFFEFIDFCVRVFQSVECWKIPVACVCRA